MRSRVWGRVLVRLFSKGVKLHEPSRQSNLLNYIGNSLHTINTYLYLTLIQVRNNKLVVP